MKKALILLTVFGLNTFMVSDTPQINHSDLKVTCKVLYELTDKAIDNNRKDLIAIYYNAYKAIRLNNKITDGCDQYFEGIQTSYGKSIGNWTLALDFPPKHLSQTPIRNFTHKELETFQRLQELNLSLEDLEQIKLLKGIQENNIDLKLLKTMNVQDIKHLNDNLNKIKVEDIDLSKLNQLPNNKINIEQFQQVIKQQ